jgi:hypothetical protein
VRRQLNPIRTVGTAPRVERRTHRTRHVAAALSFGLMLGWVQNADAGGVWGDGRALGRAAGRAVASKFDRVLTGPILVGGGAALDVDGQPTATLHVGLVFIAFRVGSRAAWFDPPGGALGYEGTVVFDSDPWGMVHLVGRYGIGPLLLGGAVGVAMGRGASFAAGPEMSLPVRVPLGGRIEIALEIFARGDFNTSSRYRHQLTSGLRLSAW